MKELISIYNFIRNIEYKIVNIEYSLSNSYNLINSNGASCTPKHIVFADKIKKLGLETRFCVHEFSWQDFQVGFPPQLLAMLKEGFIDFHTNLEVKTKDKWIQVDATWDDNLINLGFPGTKVWDGMTSTLNSVYPKKTFRFDSIGERNDYLKSVIIKDKITNEVEFINQLNNFFTLKRIENVC
ncbi:MAG: hypothetical protein K2X86_10495 [Cytophagaceae bacterium]|nr:hypothetical protein [Cytophagaceae bacterium]